MQGGGHGDEAELAAYLSVQVGYQRAQGAATEIVLCLELYFVRKRTTPGVQGLVHRHEGAIEVWKSLELGEDPRVNAENSRRCYLFTLAMKMSGEFRKSIRLLGLLLAKLGATPGLRFVYYKPDCCHYYAKPRGP